jgi:hypothetical protein
VVDAVTHATLSPTGHGYELNWPADAPRAMLWPVARAAADLLTGPTYGGSSGARGARGCSWTSPRTPAAVGAT